MLAPCAVRLVPAAAALLLCTIVGMTDGDTLTARCEAQTIKARLTEIDAPRRASRSLFAASSTYRVSATASKPRFTKRPGTVRAALCFASTAPASMPIRQW